MSQATVSNPNLIRRVRSTLRDAVCGASIRHVAGRRRIVLEPDEAAVTCLVRNGEFYIRSFIDHYQAMGFKHVFIVDNESTDRTVEIARGYPSVSVFRTSMSVGKFQAALKRAMARRLVKGGWCLDVDIDEFFDYPASDRAPLSALLGYLNTHGYTAVVTQMLDLFSDRPLSELSGPQEPEDLVSTYTHYDIANVERRDYTTSPLTREHGPANVLTNPHISLYFGGIRKTLYDLDCLLTKHSLLSRKHDLQLFRGVHYVNGARLADITCVLKHYKLTGNVVATSLQNRETFPGLQGYADLAELVQSDPDFAVRTETAEQYEGVDSLVRNGFLVVTDAYEQACSVL